MTSPALNQSWLQRNQKKTALFLGVFFLLFSVAFLWMLLHQKSKVKKTVEQSGQPQFVAVTENHGFSKEATQTALGTLSEQDKDLQEAFQKIEETNRLLQQQNQQLQAQIEVINQRLNQPASLKASPSLPVIPSGFSFSRATALPSDSVACPVETCVLPGTFVRAVLIGAADADASVNGQSNTTPVLFRILDNGTLPNGYQSQLKNCFVIGSVYGDISSERGQIKLQTLSCIKKGIPIVRTLNGNGLAYDESGRGGVRGIPVMRNDKLLLNAGIAGLASGLGTAIGQTYTTQSISPLGSTTTVDPKNIAAYSAASGTSTALGKLADYYIKRADQYHPIIQLNPGAIVDLVFLQQFNLAPDPVSLPKRVGQLVNTPPSSQLSSPTASPQTFEANQIKLGDTVSPEQAEVITSQIQQAVQQSTHVSTS